MIWKPVFPRHHSSWLCLLAGLLLLTSWVQADSAALAELKSRAESGDPDSQFRLAVAHYTAEGIDQDYTKSADWYRKAAEQGHARAANKLGGMYLKGRGVEKNQELAISWFKRADSASRENADTQEIVVSTGAESEGSSDLNSKGAGSEWDILNQEARSLYQKGQYDRAVVTARKALEVAEKNDGANHLSVATSLNDLAVLYKAQGQYAQAEPLLKRALAIREKALGPDHPHVAASLNNLAELYLATDRFIEAGKLQRRAARIRAIKVQPTSQDLAIIKNLRMISLAGIDFMLDEGVSRATLDDSIGPGKHYSSKLESVAGEDYSNIVIYTNTTRITTTTPDGRVFNYDF